MTLSTSSPQAALYAAMTRAMARIHAVAKSGRNAFHNYDYATEADIVSETREACAAEGICWFPSVVEHTTAPPDSSKRGEVLSTVVLEITWCHVEGGTMTSRWAGQGMDKGDKGYYKAYTGAVKYALLKTFMIPTGDDPEADGAPIQRKGEQARAASPPVRLNRERESPTSQRDIPSAREVVIARVKGAIKGTTMEERAVWQALCRELDVLNSKQITQEQWEQLRLALPVATAEVGHLLSRMLKGEGKILEVRS